MKSIGQLIKEELERQERSVTWFAQKLSCHRTNVYDIFARDNIDMTLLIRISRILHHNFLKDLSETVDEEFKGESL
ncbi:XRE family transcriptional regulator [Mediterranea massiliensis]|nr:XRE family transcriptional regulator [Mediterranea massiliensis]MDM8339083.1 XRE family transcriptional regulator [Mediterranea massiliensis]